MNKIDKKCNSFFKNLAIVFLILFFGLIYSCSNTTINEPKNNQFIWFEQEAKNWNEAIPIGNGTLGGMVYGGIESDTIKINEETLWSGGPRDLQNHTAINYLPRIRKLLLEHKTNKAEALIDSTMLGEYNECYLPMGDLIISQIGEGKATSYKRQLDLNKGIVDVTYTVDDVTYKKEVFASFPDKAIIVKMSADKSGQLNFSTSLTSLLNHSVEIKDNRIILKGKSPKHAYPHYLGKKDALYEEGYGMRFNMVLQIRNKGGNVTTKKDKLNVQNADEVELLFTAATSFNGYDKDPVKDGKDYEQIAKNTIESLLKMDYSKLKSRHLKDYKGLYDRVSIDLGKSSKDSIPTDERIKSFSPGTDPSLTALYYQFGRYLLISSSRPGEFAQPANLQGIWSRLLQPAWSANWTLNCNAQINYWPVETANLSELHLPLVELTKELSVDGAKTARNMYGANGWIAHHNADIWRTTSPVGGSGLWAIYQVGSAWLCHHLWEHYEFTQDKEYLKEVYPIMKGAAQFYLDNLQRDEDGFLVTNPSESFENYFVKPDGETGWACVGATQDMQIIRDLFQNCKLALLELETDTEFGVKLDDYNSQLLPMRISRTTGRLQEWKDDWKAATPFAGQVAHGWGLVVGNQISQRRTPELADAFRKTLEYRKPWEANDCGSWTGSFSANFWTRLGDGEMLQKVIDTHFEKALFPNLTSNFGEFWEIDGNLGITASIGEMLLQSHDGEIEVLPALPWFYPDGEVKGLKARGGFTIDIKWKAGKLIHVHIQSLFGKKAVLRYGEQTLEIDMDKGAYSDFEF